MWWKQLGLMKKVFYWSVNTVSLSSRTVIAEVGRRRGRTRTAQLAGERQVELSNSCNFYKCRESYLPLYDTTVSFFYWGTIKVGVGSEPFASEPVIYISAPAGLCSPWTGSGQMQDRVSAHRRGLIGKLSCWWASCSSFLILILAWTYVTWHNGAVAGGLLETEYSRWHSCVRASTLCFNHCTTVSANVLFPCTFCELIHVAVSF